MAVTPTNKVSITTVIREYFQAHGAAVKNWPKGWKQAVADRTGGTLNAIGSTRSRMARTWPTDRPHLEVVPDPEPSPPSSEVGSKLTKDEAKALQQRRALDDKRLAGITIVRSAEELPEGFQHWGCYAEKLVPSHLIPWTCANGRTVIQLQPETPPINKEGRPMKYLFPEGCGGLVGVVAGSEKTVLDPSVPLVVVEGTFQGRAVAAALEDSESSFAVVQISGCNGWMTGGEPSPEFGQIPMRGREVFFLPDADMSTNRDVYDAAKYLRENLLGEFLARDVRIIHLPGRGNDGADDLLSRHDPGHNLEMVLQWIELARGPEGKLGKAPRKRRRNSGFFNAEGNFQPATFWEHLQSHHRLALNGDKSIAVYEGGVYLNSDSRRWNNAVEQALGNNYVPQYLNTVTDLALTSLKTSGREVPQFLSEPLLNVKNGLVDLRTGELRDHTHEVVTLQQLTVEWDPKASCPTWEWLINSALPDQIERLEDVISQCIDWTQAPVKILILYGEARAGKGLILRVILWLLGSNSCSAVTLHQLAENRFMAAELFGKRANVAGELKPEEVKDISLVKMLTGEDPVQADKKYGQTFSFFNYAFLAFSCNKLPPINETTKAFSSRVSPFRFTVGHNGKEDGSLGDKLKAELPGILVRLVTGWQRRQARGNFRPTDKATADHFNENIDHVARFIRERTVPVDQLRDGIKRAELFLEFQRWCEEENLTMVALGSRNTFFEKVRNNGGIEGKDAKGINRWRYRFRRPEDKDPSETATPKGPNGSSVAENGSSVSETAVAKPVAATGEVKGKRQQRQKQVKKSEIDSGALNNQPPSENRYGQGCPELPLVPFLSGVTPASPAPYKGEPPAGIDYVCRAVDLPDPDEMAMSIGFDLETFNRRTDLWRHKASLSPSLGGEIRLAQLTGADSKTTLIIDVAVIGQPAIDWLRTLVRNPNRTLVGHNLLFEATFLIAAGIRPLCKWWDTMLACQILGDLPSNSLAAASGHYLKRELDKTEQTSDWGNGLTASQLRYAALDSVVVLPLGRELHRQLHETQQVEVHRVDCSMISACADGQVRGLAVDVPAAITSQKRATAERKALADQLHQTLNLENYRNPLKLKEALAHHLGEEIEDTKDRTLKRFRPDPVIEQLLQLKTLDQELKEVRWLLEEADLTDGRVRPCYRLIGASTGRMSTSALIRDTNSHVPSDSGRFKTGKRKGEPKPVKLGQCGFNFQGITGDRKLALGTGNPSTVLMDLDWSSIEIRLQASPELYNDDGQRRILLDGIDPHAYIASQACGREITKADPERNTIGKMANFSLAYGCGVAGLRTLLSRARGTRVTEAEARKVYEAWHQFHPQISRQMRQFDSGTTLEVRSLLGRRMTYRDHTAGADGIRPMRPLSRTNGINFPIQGSGRDLLAAALGDLWPALDPFPEVHIVGLIHDEILLEVPRDLVDQVKEIALASMTSQKLQKQYLGDIPLEADCNVAETWGEAH